jgi:hypothetical protein
MNQLEARQTLLVRAFESPLTPPWTEDDREWANREAMRAAGEGADAQHLLARRAGIALTRLQTRDPGVRAALVASAGIPVPWLWPLLAFVVGLAMDALGAQRTINLFALPLLGMLAWNLVVYAALAMHALRKLLGPAQDAARSGPVRQAIASLLAALQRGVQRLSGRVVSPAIERFLVDWWDLARPLHAARLATLLHLGAATLATGALTSLYARGVFFDYRAGWESTFFDAAAMHRAITWLLGPAAWLSGLALPNATEFAALRLPGGTGDGAARWIHLLALTVAGVVIVPRLLLAAMSGWQASRRARELPLPLDEPYFARLTRGLRGDTVTAQVLPYNYQAATSLRAGLQRALEQHLGTRVQLHWADPVPLGGEDALDARGPGLEGAAQTVLLFALTATPERETHGAFVQAMARRLSAGQELLVLVDESAFRQRFTGPDGATRLAQRHAAWRTLLKDIGHAPLFADLAHTEAAS